MVALRFGSFDLQNGKSRLEIRFLPKDKSLPRKRESTSTRCSSVPPSGFPLSRTTVRNILRRRRNAPALMGYRAVQRKRDLNFEGQGAGTKSVRAERSKAKSKQGSACPHFDFALLRSVRTGQAGCVGSRSPHLPWHLVARQTRPRARHFTDGFITDSSALSRE
ncbi:MAG: hypothetical protein JWL63_2016 [Rhodocyclales bacterium]|nr:hypothetical protein [Rhodocyclales bacterium]